VEKKMKEMQPLSQEEIQARVSAATSAATAKKLMEELEAQVRRHTQAARAPGTRRTAGCCEERWAPPAPVGLGSARALPWRAERTAR